MAIVLERPTVTAGENEALAARASTGVYPLYMSGDDTPHPTLHDTAVALLLAAGEYGGAGERCALLRAAASAYGA